MFDRVLAYGEYGRNKRDGIARCLELSGGRADMAVMIGDSVSDLTAARQAGAKAIAVTWGHTDEDTLRQASPDEVASNPADIPDLVSELLF